MLNILIPLAGKSNLITEEQYPFPKPLIEINNKTIIERVIENISNIDQEIMFIFILNDEDCSKYHFDSTLNMITNGNCKIIKLKSLTKGSACSSIMAIDYIDNDTPLLILNSDQIFDVNLSNFIKDFQKYDAGVIVFDSVHPRWSYAKLNESNYVIETAEKHPISRNAIAGFYFFKKGKIFIENAMRMIIKDESVNGIFYIAPTLNQMILNNNRILALKIDIDKYHTFYTLKKIKEYENHINIKT